MKTLLILDIDGCIADATERFQRAGQEPSRENRTQYLQWLHNVQNETTLSMDKPVPGMLALANSFELLGTIAYVTSREEKYREVTRRWLEQHQFPSSHQLYMRGQDDWRSSGEMKEAIIKVLAVPYGAVVICDDDPRGDVQEAAQRNGWTFLKATSGGKG